MRRLADEVLQSLPRIDVLVHNVGGYWNARQVTADGPEHTFAVNHLAPFVLTNLLLDRLKQSALARVVMVCRPWDQGPAGPDAGDRPSSCPALRRSPIRVPVDNGTVGTLVAAKGGW